MQNTQKRWFDIPSIICLALAFWISGLRLQVTHWTEGLDKVEMALIFSLVIGLVIGFSKFNRKTAVWMGIAYSVLTLTWILSFVMKPDMVWSEKLLSLLTGVNESLGQFFRNEPAQNSILFLFFMIIGYWCIGFLAGYQLTRQGSPWLPVIVIFIVMLVIDYYPPYIKNRYLYSAVFVLFSVFLVGRLYYLHSLQKWQKKSAMVDYGASFDFSRLVVSISLVLVLLSWGIPELVRLFIPGTREQQKFVEFWDPLQDRLSNAVSDLQAPQSTSADFFAKDLFLGSEVSQDDTPVFEVTVSKDRPGGFSYYWRGHAYDYYQNGKWENTIESFFAVSAEEWPLNHPEWAARSRVGLLYEWQYSRSRILYLPNIPLKINRPVKIVGEQVSIDEGEYLDDIVIYVDNSIYSGEKIEVTSWVSSPTIDQLQASGEIYPFWVTERYLQLPDDLPQSITILAEEITKDFETPYDKAQAITQYLRDEIQYEKSIGNPPAGADPLEWFLFDLKKGFCNYYATAEVIMLRSVGVPARLTVGFAEGELQEDNKTYLVRKDDSHAWPEVYFPALGWIEFEPTVSQPMPILVSEKEEAEQPRQETSTRDFHNEFSSYAEQRYFLEFLDEGIYAEEAYLPRLYNPVKEWTIFICVILLNSFVFWFEFVKLKESRKRTLPGFLEAIIIHRGWEVPELIKFLSFRASLAPIEKYFSEVNWMLSLMKKHLDGSSTPAEQVQSLKEVLGAEDGQYADVLLVEYEKFVYSQYDIDLQRASQAHRQLWRVILKAKFIQWIHVRRND